MPAKEHDVAALADLPDGGLSPVTIGEDQVLLVRHGDTVHAIGATCPHAGAPLTEGVRNGDRLVCPWHKAAFCVRSGAVLEPPALDDLPSYAVRVQDGRVLVTTPAIEPPPAEPVEDGRCFVIVGGGAAGAVAAQTLRQHGFNGRLVMLDRENRVPYDRTLLSKYVLSGQQGGEKSPLQSQSFYREHRIERRTAEVIRLDAAARRITCADGSVLSYDAALLATGGNPRRLDLPGVNLRNVFHLRTRGDADAILAQAERSTKAVVLGTGFIGMEVAASLRERGLDVTVVGKDSTPFEKPLGVRVGTALARLHERRGVAFRLGQEVGALIGEDAVRAVRLSSNEKIRADLVVLGFGIIPATGYLQGVRLNPDGGIPVGADLCAAEGLYAAGDIASFPLYGDGEPVRVEHWRVAQQHGRAAAVNMLRRAGQGARYDKAPVFWTIQYLQRLDYVGHAGDWDDVVVHGDLEKPEFLAYYVRNGRVTAAVGFGRDKDTSALAELFNRRHDWTAAELGASPASLLS